MINNIIVSRLSLKISPQWDQEGELKFSDRDTWFRFRAELFLNNVHHSIKNQTVKPRQVYVLIDENDQELYNQYLSDLPADLYTPILVESYYCIKNTTLKLGDSAEQIYADLCKRNIEKNVAISRLDSDDFISCNYLESVNDTIKTQNADIVYVPTGWASNLDQWVVKTEKHGPFVTVYKNQMTVFDIYGKQHHEWSKDHYWYYKISHSTDCTWIQYIHNTNIANQHAFNNGKKQILDKNTKKQYFKL